MNDNLDKFIDYMQTPDGDTIYKEALSKVRELIHAGWTTYGINSIIEQIRWDRAVELGPKGKFKINNNIAPYLARALLVYNSDIPRTFFKLKTVRGVGMVDTETKIMTNRLEASIPITDIEKSIIVAVNTLTGKLPGSHQEYTKTDIIEMVMTKVVANDDHRNKAIARVEIYLTLKKD